MLRMSSGVGAPRASARGGFAARASTSAAASARTPRRRSHETGPFRRPLAVAPARAPTATTRRRLVRVAVINNDCPANRSADESFADESSDAPRLPRDARPSLSDDFIGVDEFGVGIRGDAKFRRRSEARDAYWREQARELEQALAASGDSETKVVISEKGRLFLRSDEEAATERSQRSPSPPATREKEKEKAAASFAETNHESVSATNAFANDSAVASLPTDTTEKERAALEKNAGAPPTWTWRERFALLAQISALGLPALVNSCVEPLLSSAETACAAKIGTVYLAALAPSSSLFAFAAEMCFAMSVVVTTAVAKAAAKAAKAREALRTAAGETSGDADEETLAADAEAAAATSRRTATAATTTSFFVGAVLAVGLAALADPLLRMMHVPPETAPIVRAYVATRALGLPFFAASNAAEGVYIGHGDGVAPMAAWTCTGAGTMAALLLFAHPAALNWGLPGAAAAIAVGQIATAAWFARGMRRRGWLASSKDVGSVGERSASDVETDVFTKALLGCRDALDVLKRTKMANEIGWMFLGAVSRMGTYAILTASASALGVVPGATHKVALEIFWLLSFLTEPIFTACNALLPRELAQGKIHAARRLRDALVVTAVALGCALACAGGALANMGVFSDDPAVAAALKSLAAPLAASLGLAATAYGVEGTIIGCGQVGYLGRTHCRDFFVVAFLLWAREAAFPGGGGLAGTWWLLAGFQGLRICQHWFHLWRNKPFLTYSAEAEEEAEHEVVPPAAEQAAEPEGGREGLALA